MWLDADVVLRQGAPTLLSITASRVLIHCVSAHCSDWDPLTHAEQFIDKTYVFSPLCDLPRILLFILQRERMSYVASQPCNFRIDETGELLVVCGDFITKTAIPWYKLPDEGDRRAMIIDVSFRAALFHIHN